MTKSQTNELQELRSESLRNKEIVKRLEVEIDDTEFEIAYLMKWKKGRGTGFFISLAILVGSLFTFVFYTDVHLEGDLSRFDTKSGAMTFSISTTVLMCLILIIIVLTIFTFYLGIKLVMELGSSTTARKLAAHFGHKNYYTKITPLQNRLNDQKKELIELKAKNGQLERRILELSKDETPWYEQQGPARINYY